MLYASTANVQHSGTACEQLRASELGAKFVHRVVGRLSSEIRNPPGVIGRRPKAKATSNAKGSEALGVAPALIDFGVVWLRCRYLDSQMRTTVNGLGKTLQGETSLSYKFSTTKKLGFLISYKGELSTSYWGITKPPRNFQFWTGGGQSCSFAGGTALTTCHAVQLRGAPLQFLLRSVELVMLAKATETRNEGRCRALARDQDRSSLKSLRKAML